MADTEKKVSGLKVFFKGVVRWFREMRSELKKVVWPTWKQVLNNSMVVIIMVLIVGAIIGVFDFITGQGVSALISLGH